MVKIAFNDIAFFITALMLSNRILSDFPVILIGENVLSQMLSLMIALSLGVVILILYKKKKVDFL